MTRLPSLWNRNFSVDPAEFRAPILSLYDSMVTDMFKSMDPFREMSDDVKTRAYPKVDVRQDERDLVFEAVVPFVKKENLDVNIKDGVLKISGKIAKDEKIEEGNFVKRELVRSSFARSFPLNETMFMAWDKEGGEVKADLNEGVLTVKLVNFLNARGDPNTTRKIDIE